MLHTRMIVARNTSACPLVKKTQSLGVMSAPSYQDPDRTPVGDVGTVYPGTMVVVPVLLVVNPISTLCRRRVGPTAALKSPSQANSALESLR